MSQVNAWDFMPPSVSSMRPSQSETYSTRLGSLGPGPTKSSPGLHRADCLQNYRIPHGCHLPIAGVGWMQAIRLKVG